MEVKITQITQSELESLFEKTLSKFLNNHQEVKETSDDEIFSVIDAAKFLMLSKARVYFLISKGELPVMKRSKRCYFLKKDLINYLKQGRRKTKSEIESETDTYLLTNKKKLQNGK